MHDWEKTDFFMLVLLVSQKFLSKHIYEMIKTMINLKIVLNKFSVRSESMTDNLSLCRPISLGLLIVDGIMPLSIEVLHGAIQLNGQYRDVGKL